VYVIDVAQGDDIPRKGGLGIGRSDLLVVNKKDLAPYVGVDLARMDNDLAAARGPMPYFFTNLRAVEGLEAVLGWVRARLAEGPRIDKPLWAGSPTLKSAILEDHHHGPGHSHDHAPRAVYRAAK
jgi:urease accessory protein